MENIISQPAEHAAKVRACDELEDALAGNLGKTVSAHERMILQYYRDVQQQAIQSFGAAKRVAWIGFGVLIGTLLYALVFDALGHFDMLSGSRNLLTVGGIGVVSGVLIEFIAGVNFWLYGKAAKQFGAFHICLERTHRYLIAYKISEEMQDKKEETLQKIVCIMANAPMITAKELAAIAGTTPDRSNIGLGESV